MLRKAVSVIMLAFLFVGVLMFVFDIQLTRAESETVRIDNLIITSFDLEAAATRLAQWKNSCGIPSKVLNVTWIYSHYSGVDEPEKIRNCIKDFHSNSQTKYVTIFGDVDKVPIRYAYVPDPHENSVSTDLYYADLDYTWDDNGDGLYADLDNDVVDGIPDVYVGRIPASFDNTAEDVVTKIIEYQQSFDASEDWVSRIVLAAGMDGDTTVALSEYISNVVSDKNVIKLYEPEGNLTNDALDFEIDRGCIFLNFAGHSGENWFPGIVPDSWILRPIYLGPIVVDYEKYGWQDALDRTNGRKLPVIVTMSCVSAKVDWTGPLGGECLGEYFVMNPNGGAIAYFGSTGIAWCPTNGSAPYGLMGEIDRRVYEAFYDGDTRLGDMWGVALTEYLEYKQLDKMFYDEDGNPIGYLNEKTIMEFILLGDPTSRIYNGPETLKVPEEYATIQGAINSAYSGDTIKVANGNYHEHVVVNKTVSLVGESRYSTVIIGDGTGTVVYVKANKVKIAGFAIAFGNIGIITDWRYGQNVEIVGNIIDHNERGVILDEVYDSTFADNQVSCNDNYGIQLLHSIAPRFSNNTIVNNTIWDNGCGIWLDGSCGNTVINNTITQNEVGIQLDESVNNDIYHNNFIGNTVQANVSTVIPHHYEENFRLSYYCCDPNDHINITDHEVVQEFTHNEQAYVIRNCAESFNDFEVLFEAYNYYADDEHTDLQQCVFCVANEFDDLYHIQFGAEPSLSVRFYHDFRIVLCESHSSVVGCVGWDGVELGRWYYFNLTKVGSQAWLRIYDDAERTDLLGTLYLNLGGDQKYGYIYATNAYNIGHARHGKAKTANFTITYILDWDDGYPSAGNYWSDYTGVDLFSGPYQNVAGSDGIGDTPYVIDVNNTDHYPLMNPWPLNPSIAVRPSFKEVILGSSFTLDLNVSVVSDLNLWVITVEWDPSIIELQSYYEGPFLKAGGSTDIMDAGVSPGKVEELICLILGPGSVSGSGCLVTFTFNAVGLGITPVNITFSALANSNGEHISHDTYDGVVQVSPPPNHPPSAPAVDVTPDSPYTTDDLTCTVTTPSTDLDGDLITYTYKWYRDGNLEQTTVTVGLTDTLSSTLTAKGEVWKCVVTPNDGEEDGSSDEDQVTIGNTPPTAPTVDVTPNSPVTMDDLTCTVITSSSDPDADTVIYTYEWYKNGILQPAETTVTTALSDTVLSSRTKRDEVWKCVVTPNDGTVDGPLDEDSVTILDSPPIASNVEITPSTPYTTDDLVGSYDYSDVNNDADSGTQIRWYKDDVLQSAYNDQLTIPSLTTSENEEWYFTVKPKDGTDFGNLVDSNKVTIQPSPQYELTVTSSPITGIPFTIDGTPQTTPYTEWFLEGSYSLEMPETHNGYVWSHWLEDGDTDRTKTIHLHGTTWTGVFIERHETSIKGETVVIEDNVAITKMVVTKNTLHFDASGPTGEIGWINVIFPKVNTTEIKVFIDKQKLTPPPFPIITTNGTHYFIYFEFKLSTHNIEIQFAPLAPPVPVGGVWVPINKTELLTLWITLASLITVAIASVVYVKHRKTKLRGRK